MCRAMAEPTPSLLLELAASNDISSFKHHYSSIQIDNQSSLWYGRSLTKKMGFLHRTPLMIAALYGSLDVLNFILDSNPAASIDDRSDSDGATALLLASSGASPNSSPAVHILTAAGATSPNPNANPSPSASPSPKSPKSPTFTPKTTEEVKKREYPQDVVLPDINQGIYASDEFRMYAFKVKPCSRAYTHDWTECPFVHPGENARRRDPRKYDYSCVPCPEFRKASSCVNGDGCDYAHGIFESWLHPLQYKTRLCKDDNGCNRKVCFFAHKPQEVRSVNPNTAAAVTGMGACSSPRSPSSAAAVSAAMGTPGVWMNHQPALQLSSSRLRSTLSSRDINVDIDLSRLAGYQNKILDQIHSFASSPGNNVPSSSSFGLDSSMAKAIMSSRSAAFAQRSQSFIDRGRVPSGLSARPSNTAMGLSSSWGSPDGKLDWGIQGEELNRLRKSTSFGFRNNPVSSPPREAALEEPDLSWVQSLVKDAPANASLAGPPGFHGRKQQYRTNGDILGADIVGAWGEEQMVN